MYQDKLVEVRRANGTTEYIETNQHALEAFVPIERFEIVEKYNFNLEILGKEIFVFQLNIQDITIIYSHLAKSYCKLAKEIKNLILLDVTTRQIEREYYL